MVPVSAADEARHRPSGAPGWHEAHRVDAWSSDGGLGLSWSVTARPATGRVSFLASVLRRDEPSIVLAEDDIELPAARWEVRTSGLWADCVCETPLDHWSYGLESFALIVSDPAELRGRGLGDRVALGWELEFEASGEARWDAPDAYRQDGEVHGIVLVGRQRLEVSLAGVRRHWWGSAPPPVFDTVAVPGATALPEPGGCWWIALAGGGLHVSRQPDGISSGTASPGS